MDARLVATALLTVSLFACASSPKSPRMEKHDVACEAFEDAIRESPEAFLDGRAAPRRSILRIGAQQMWSDVLAAHPADRNRVFMKWLGEPRNGVRCSALDAFALSWADAWGERHRSADATCRLYDEPFRGCAEGVNGTLSKDDIATATRPSVTQIRSCYETTLTRTPEAKGTVTAHFRIAASGAVDAVHVRENTTGLEGLAHCVLSVMCRTRFPQPREAGCVTVTYPFVLNVRGKTPAIETK